MFAASVRKLLGRMSGTSELWVSHPPGIEAAAAARTHQRIAQGAAALRHADARYRPAAAGRIGTTPTTHKPRIGGAWRRILGVPVFSTSQLRSVSNFKLK